MPACFLQRHLELGALAADGINRMSPSVGIQDDSSLVWGSQDVCVWGGGGSTRGCAVCISRGSLSVSQKKKNQN